MLVCYLRSSSVGSYEYCQTSFFFRYVLGWEEPSKKKADLGNSVHKALEILARQKLAQQNGVSSFVEEETGIEFNVDHVTPQLAMRVGYDHYHNKAPTRPWTDKDFRDCEKWFNTVLTYGDGAYDPRKRTIVAPELFFDLTIDKPWANYEYQLPDGTVLSGQLAVKGTTDLVTQIAPGVLEMLDWKTGRRINWGTGKEKDYDCLSEDFQLSLYSWALHKVFPDHIIHSTIFYAKDGGPFSLPDSEFDEERVEGAIRRHFERIRDNNQPTATDQKWKCRICGYKEACPQVRDDLVQLGMDAVITKYADLSKLGSYGSGGGKANREGK